MRRRLVLAAVLIGVLGGTIAAIAVPRHRPSNATAHAPAPPRIDTPAHALVAQVSRRVAGPISEIVRADPRGGPPWVLETFRGQRVVRARDRRTGVSPVVGHGWCAELGRRVGGQFGWIDATNTFRETRHVPGASPAWCGSRLPDLRGLPQLEVVTTISNPSLPTATPQQSVIYGFGGPASKFVDLAIGGHKQHVAVSHDGGFLVFAPAGTPQSEVVATFHYDGGHAAVTVDHAHAQDSGPGAPAPDVGPTDAALTAAALAPDPLGGVPYTLAAVPAADGGWCASEPARLVGNLIGTVDERLGIVRDLPRSLVYDCSGADTGTAPAEPLRVSYGGGVGELDSRSQARARIARRSQPGVFQISGIAAPDVKLVTIATPRDVRTLLPSKPAHAFLAVYDGQFPAGQITLTSTLSDGTTHVQRIDDPGF